MCILMWQKHLFWTVLSSRTWRFRETYYYYIIVLFTFYILYFIEWIHLIVEMDIQSDLWMTVYIIVSFTFYILYSWLILYLCTWIYGRYNKLELPPSSGSKSKPSKQQAFCLLVASLTYSLALKMEVVSSSGTSVNFYQTTLCPIHPEDSTLHSHCLENLGLDKCEF
jgi:hypothetical protein